MSTLRTCPDCGGILDATLPEWQVAIDIYASSEPGERQSPAWQCLICGYREEETSQSAVLERT
jgi:hypothetical protein